MPIIDYDKFAVKDAVSSGGVTGSSRVKMDGKNYQLKPTILDNKFARKLKAGWTDRENFGEVIASKIVRPLLVTTDFEAAPDVSLVYNQKEGKTLIASKYLEGDKVRTLDAYIVEKNPDIKPKHHVKFVDGTKAEVGKGQYDISGQQNSSLRQDIAKGIAGSIISGDHDVNPGNFIVVSAEGKDRVARIDFGHAFNDLLNTSKAFGGKVRNKDNQVLDYINRGEVAGAKFGSPSKLWRDYPGMIPTKEMADAFKELSESTALKEGVGKVREEFSELLKEMEKTGDKKGIQHLQKSLEAISNNISGFKLDSNLTPEQTIAATFAVVEKFASDKQNQMKDAAKLMQLQVDIDKIIDDKKEGVEPSKDQVEKLKSQYAELEKAKGIGQKDGGIEWVKTDAKKSAHKGDLESYIKSRGENLGIAKEKTKELVHHNFELPKKPGFLTRAYNKIFGGPQSQVQTSAVVKVEKQNNSEQPLPKVKQSVIEKAKSIGVALKGSTREDTAEVSAVGVRETKIKKGMSR